MSYGSIGSGSLGHLAMALLGKGSNLDWTHIPYKGGGPLMTDAVAGHVPLSIGSVFVTKPHIDNKRMRPLAVTTTKRSPDLRMVGENPEAAEAQGIDVIGGSVDVARTFIERQIDVWAKVVKDNNIKPD